MATSPGVWYLDGTFIPWGKKQQCERGRVGGQNALFGEVFDFLRIITEHP